MQIVNNFVSKNISLEENARIMRQALAFAFITILEMLSLDSRLFIVTSRSLAALESVEPLSRRGLSGLVSSNLTRFVLSGARGRDHLCDQWSKQLKMMCRLLVVMKTLASSAKRS